MSSEFRAHLTRKRYMELVGISKSTLVRWEKAGVLQPQLQEILSVPTRVFSDDEVAFGKRLRKLLRDRYGELSVEQAADQIRNG